MYFIFPFRPKLARLDTSGVLHHVMGRGIERNQIFFRRVVVEAWGVISWIAVRELGYSGADVARYLDVTNSCVTRLVASGKKPDVDDLI